MRNQAMLMRKIERVRKAAKIPLEEYCKRLGFTRMQYYNYKHGFSQMPYYRAIDMLKSMGLDLAVIEAEEEEEEE